MWRPQKLGYFGGMAPSVYQNHRSENIQNVIQNSTNQHLYFRYYAKALTLNANYFQKPLKVLIHNILKRLKNEPSIYIQSLYGHNIFIRLVLNVLHSSMLQPYISRTIKPYYRTRCSWRLVYGIRCCCYHNDLLL